MAEKWQQWMPLDVNDWRGSPSVRAMHPAARSGYMDLILAQWDSEDCTLPNDAIELAELSFLGDELWGTHGARILRKFELLDNGRLRNTVCYEKWLKAKAVYDEGQAERDRQRQARSEAGKNGAAKRWHGKPMANGSFAIANPSQSHAPVMANDGLTGTGTETKTEEQKQKPSRAKRERKSDERHTAFKEEIRKYWAAKNPGLEMPWGAPEGQALGIWLGEAPHITLEQFTGFLRARFRSDVNHGERPSQWIRWITSFGNGPIDRYGKPKNGGQDANKGNRPYYNHKSKTAGNIDEANAALSLLAGQELGSTGDSTAGECIEGHFSPLCE